MKVKSKGQTKKKKNRCSIYDKKQSFKSSYKSLGGGGREDIPQIAQEKNGLKFWTENSL